MKTLLAIWSDADVDHRALQSKPGGQNGDEHPGIEAVEDHLEHAIQRHQSGDVIRVPFCKLVPYQHHRNAASDADENQAAHVGRLAAQEGDGKQNINTGPMIQFWSNERPRTRRLRKTSPSFS